MTRAEAKEKAIIVFQELSVEYERIEEEEAKRNGTWRPVLAIMIGIQGSGKSTFCKEQLTEYRRINLDTLHTRNKERIAFCAAIADNVDIVIDNTNPTVADRLRYIKTGKTAGYRIVGYFMQSVLKDCIARNDKRDDKDKVPVKAIAATSNRLEMPSYREGFDELYFVEITEEGYKVSEWREENDI